MIDKECKLLLEELERAPLGPEERVDISVRGVPELSALRIILNRPKRGEDDSKSVSIEIVENSDTTTRATG